MKEKVTKNPAVHHAWYGDDFSLSNGEISHRVSVLAGYAHRCKAPVAGIARYSLQLLGTVHHSGEDTGF